MKQSKYNKLERVNKEKWENEIREVRAKRSECQKIWNENAINHV